MTAFRTSGLGEYIEWLRQWIEAGNSPTHAYDYPFTRWTWLTAQRDFTTGGECGSLAVNILVPPGVRHVGGALGHNLLYLTDGDGVSLKGRSVPVFSDPEFATLAGVPELIEQQRRKDAESLRASEQSLKELRAAAADSSIGRHLGR